jgi:hypothetical protein
MALGLCVLDPLIKILFAINGYIVEIYKYIKYTINQKMERERKRKYVIDYIELRLILLRVLRRPLLIERL